MIGQGCSHEGYQCDAKACRVDAQADFLSEPSFRELAEVDLFEMHAHEAGHLVSRQELASLEAEWRGAGGHSGHATVMAHPVVGRVLGKIRDRQRVVQWLGLGVQRHDVNVCP